MRLIDMHCDTMYELYRREDMNLKRNALCVDLDKMKRAGSVAQFFACFIYMGQIRGDDRWDRGYEYAKKMLGFAKNEIDMYPKEIALAKSYGELLSNEKNDKMSAFLTVEEGGILNNDIRRLKYLYDEGIRLITLTWNEENCIGYPNSCDAKVMGEGLKPFGIEVVECMNEIGMIIDVSHLSDGGFWDVLKHSKGPVVASHSNARTLLRHPRNLTDDMIRALSDQGGVAGLNFYPYFLAEDGRAGIDDLIRHIEHMYRVGGEDFVAMGTDFDGFDEGESELLDISEMERLYEALKKRKFNDGQIEKFWYKNAMRAIREVGKG